MGRSWSNAKRLHSEIPEPMEGILPHLTWSDRDIPVRKWIVDGIIPAKTVTLLQGDGGLGKSLLTLQLAHAAATGRSWIGQPTRPCKVFALYCEDDSDEIHRRLHDINEHYCQREDDLPGHFFGDLENLRIASRVGMDNMLMEFDGPDGAGDITNLLYQLEAESDQHGAELIIVDSLHDLFGGNENNRVQARQFVNALQRIALKRDGAVLINAHPSAAGLSSGSGTSGSTAWNNSVRSRLYLAREKLETDKGRATGPLCLEIMKSNYAAIGERIELEWKYGFFEPVNATDNRDPLYRKISAEDAFLRCLRAATKRGSRVTESVHGTYAPKKFSSMAEAKGFTQFDLKAAMERLFNGEKIKNGRFPGDKNHRAGIIECAPQPMGRFYDI